MSAPSRAPAVRRCGACGATVEVPADQRSTTCVFCASALIDAGADAVEPIDRVVPFTVPRALASDRIREFLGRRWFAPEAVRRASQPSELRDVLVPFYAFDAVARTQFSSRIGMYWYRTETYTVVVNGKRQVRTRQVRETEWFALQGSHARQWFGHLVSASRGLPEAEANALEPFDLGAGVPYAPARIAGLTAEYATVPRGEAERTARQELADLEHRVISSGHLPGDTYADLQSETTSELESPALLLLPIWIAALRTSSGTVRLSVNGQTGEVVGTGVPVSWVKVAVAVGLCASVVLLVALAFGFGSGVWP